jgi:phage terminase large subunit-like protein
MDDPATALTRMKTDDNPCLAPAYHEQVDGRYRGTVLGRQELDGELIEDRPDALWQRAMFRRAPAGIEPLRTVVAVDPPVTGNEKSDACGIVVAARTATGAVVLEDATLRPAPPATWAARAVAAWRAHEADAIVAEVNQGGDMVKAIIAQAAPEVPVRAVRATRGKWVRAEPVAALYARGLILHAPGLAHLEDELCAFGPDGRAHGHSPDRVDALVWALTELFEGTGPRIRVV